MQGIKIKNLKIPLSFTFAFVHTTSVVPITSVIISMTEFQNGLNTHFETF
jgi:hypothetical protein